MNTYDIKNFVFENNENSRNDIPNLYLKRGGGGNGFKYWWAVMEK